MQVPFLNLDLIYKNYQKEMDEVWYQVMRKGMYILGPEIDHFEKEFSKVMNTNWCVGVANGTDAIEIGLRALGIGPGKEVITTPFTAMPTIMGILSTGASIRLADVYPNTGLINPNEIIKVITKKTAAIVPVHLYGQICDMNAICRIAKEYNVKILEDCAQAHLASYCNTLAGNFADLASWSFYPTKNLGAFGDAGAITGKSEDGQEIVSMLRNYGQREKNNHICYGRNSRMDELQAAFLRVRLTGLTQETQRRRKIASYYQDRLRGALEIITTACEDNLQDPCYHLFVVLAPKERDTFCKKIQQRGVGTLIHYPKPAHRQSFFKDFADDQNSLCVSEFLSEKVVSLPLHPYLTDTDVEKVVQVVKASV